jgi:hypothetical protein
MENSNLTQNRKKSAKKRVYIVQYTFFVQLATVIIRT